MVGLYSTCILVRKSTYMLNHTLEVIGTSECSNQLILWKSEMNRAAAFYDLFCLMAPNITYAKTNRSI